MANVVKLPQRYENMSKEEKWQHVLEELKEVKEVKRALILIETDEAGGTFRITGTEDTTKDKIWILEKAKAVIMRTMLYNVSIEPEEE